MTIQQEIEKIVNRISGLSYFFGNWMQANVDFDFLQCKFPICLNILPPSGSIILKNGKYRQSVDCMFAFLDMSELDFDARKDYNVVNNMLNFAKQFIEEVNKSNLFEPIYGDVPYSTVYDKLDQNLTGVIIEIKLKELTGNCI